MEQFTVYPNQLLQNIDGYLECNDHMASIPSELSGVAESLSGIAEMEHLIPSIRGESENVESYLQILYQLATALESISGTYLKWEQKNIDNAAENAIPFHRYAVGTADLRELAKSLDHYGFYS